MRRPILAAAAAAAALAAVAGAATLAHGSTTKAAAAGKAGKAGALVKLRKTSLGTVVVDGRGRTLYLFEADRGRTSACYGKCAAFWPPLTTQGKPRAGKGVSARLLGTTKRKGGGLQVTYGGHPLYLFLQDTRAGQVNGQGVDGFGAEWYVVSAAGRKLEHAAAAGDDGTTPAETTPAPATTTTTPDPGGGYGGGGYGGGGY